MKDAIDNAYVSKDDKGIHLLREDIFLKVKAEFRKVKSAKSKEKLVFIMDWYRAVGKQLLMALNF